MKKSNRINSLSFQIAFVIIITLLSTGIAFDSWFSFRLTESNKALKVEEIIALGKSLSSSVILDLTAENYVAIEQLLLKTQDFSNIALLSVISNEGLKISEVARNRNWIFEPTFIIEKVSVPGTETITVIETDNNIDAWIPMNLGSKNLGWITIKLDTIFLQQLKKQHLITMSVASFFILSCSLLALYWFLRPRMKSLAHATQFASSLSTNYGDTIENDLGSLELNELANALNQASINLAQKDKQITEKQNLLIESNHNLEERVKELNGIYSMSRILNNPEIDLETKLQSISELLPLAWQFPAICSCRIVYQGTSFVSMPFKGGEYVLKENIFIDQRNIGSITIYYSEYPSSFNKGVFLEEEIFLIQEVAISLSNYLKQYQTQRELERVNENLELRVRERTQELEAAILEAEKANNAKTEFLSRVSHELRTPMNAVIGFATLLNMDKKNPLIEKQKMNIKYILDASEHLMKLINEILEISRIEKGKIDLHFEYVSTEAAIKELLPMFLPMAKGKNINLELIESNVNPAKVKLDLGRFKQVIINLLSNAIKYNVENGRVQISIIYTDFQRQEIHISDTGIGMVKEDLKVIFDPFKRLKGTESEEGAGIGLAVVKLLVELMNGQISVDSEPGKGTTFILSFNLDSSSDNFSNPST